MPVTEINGQKWSFSLEEYLELTQRRIPASALPESSPPPIQPIAAEAASPPTEGATSTESLSSEDRQLIRAIDSGPKVARRVAAAMGNVLAGVFMAELMRDLDKSRPELSRAFTDLEKIAESAGLPKTELVIRKQDGRQIRFSPGPTLRRIYPALMRRLSR